MFKIFQFVKLQFQPKVQPIILGRWKLKRDEKSEYFAVLNANRDNCYKSYNTSKKEKYTLEELIIISHTNSFPIKKNNV